MKSIVLGGGCFWCMEAVFQKLEGVLGVSSGYAGGNTPNPSYEEVSSGKTGHAEVVKIDYDPKVISLETILSVFFYSHDPTSINQQGNDIGEQYRSVIFYDNPEDEKIIKFFIEGLEHEKVFSRQIVTEILPLKNFFSAENYHRDYYLKHPEQAYCRLVIDPKIRKLRENFAKYLKN